mgnify:FL=1
MKIAVITGASSGMGREFVYALDRDEEFDELWVIARREDRLRELQSKCRAKVRPLALDLQDIRLMLEPETCAIVARGATPEQIDQMQAYCDEATRLIEAEEDYSAADAKFHRYLAECSGNHVLPNLIPIIASAIGVVITVTNDEHRSQSGMEHQRIVDAIRRHDPEGAKYSMIAHLNTSRNSMLHSRDNCAAKR